MECKNLLFIDPSVRDYQVFVDSVNTDTYPILYDEIDFPDLGTFERIGIVFTNTPDLLGNSFFTSLPDVIRKYQVSVVDFLACNTLLDPAWLDYYEFLKSETGVTIGASDDLTGNLKYGGDWVMESTSQDIEPIYFTQKIEYYQYLLDFSITTLLSLNGLLWGVGNNSYGQLGIGDTAGRQVFTNLTDFQTPAFKSRTIQSYSTAYSTKITPVGMGHTVLLMDDNSVWGAGANNASQLGRVSGSTLRFQPLSGYTGIPYLVATGPTHTMIATKNNASYELWSTGSATTYGAVYFFNSTMKSTVFVKLTSVTLPIASIVSNEDHNIILYGSSMYSLGYNGLGQLGTGNTSTSATFNIIPATSVEATAYSTLFMSNGSVYGTGAAQYNGSSVQTNTFQLCATNASLLSGGLEHVLLLKRDNTLWGCGNNNSGQLTLSTTSFTQIPFNYGTIQSIQAGWKQTLVVNTYQRIFATGNNLYGQLGTNTTANVSQFQEVFFPLLFTPSAGATNTSITVTGVNTRNFSAVVCGGNVVESVVSTNSVVFRAPALSGNVSVGVQYKNTTLSSKILLSNTLFTYQNQNVSTVSVSSGPVRTQVVIQGVFLKPQRVVFGIQDASFVQIGGIVQATAPIGTGNVSIQLIDSLQNVAFAGKFLYQNASVTRVGPLAGPTGTAMTIGGTFLNSSRVVFGSRDASFVNVSTGINLSVPNGSGNVSIQLIDTLQNILVAGIFHYQNASVTQMTPIAGTTRTSVTISGEYLNPVRVLFGSRDASFNLSSELHVFVPSGTGNVSVLLIDALQNTTLAGDFDYQNPTGYMIPSFGTTRTPITIPITNLDPIQVLFGTQDISFNVSTNVSNDSTLLIKAPTGTRNVSVTVVDRLQNVIEVGEFIYQNASVYSMVPSYGTRNTPVMITGDYLNPSTIVFGQIDASFVNASGIINLIVPDGSGNVSVQWTDSLSNTGDAGIFSYHNPTLSYVTAAAGLTHTLLTLYGDYLDTFTHLYYEEETPVVESPIVLSILNTTGILSMIGVDVLENEWPLEFDLTTLIPHISEVVPGISGSVATFYGGLLGNTTQVFFGEENVSLLQVSSGFVQVIIPNGYGEVPVSLLDTNGYAAQVTFTYLTPRITSLSVPGAPTNTTLTLRGTNLIDTIEVWFGNTSTTFSANLTTIQASVPVGIGNVSVSAIDQYGQRAQFDGLFTFRNPIVTDVRPRFAPSNSALTLTGNYLSEISTVYFGNLSTQEFAGFVDTLYVTVPVATGAVPIRVVDRYGNQNNAPGFFTFDSYPIKRVYPLEGVRHDYVEIEAPLETITSVTFGNNLAQVYQLTNQFWVAQVPSGGIVKIQDPSGKCGLWSMPFQLKIPVVESADLSGNMLTLQGTGFGVVETVVVQTLSALHEKTETQIILELPCSCDSIDLVDARGNRVTYPFVYEGPPIVEGPITLTAMTPAGPEFYRLRIEGTNFLHANGNSRISKITLQNAPATNIEVVSSSLIYCTAPGGVGRSHLDVFDEFGQDVPTSLLYFYLIPALTDVSPNQGIENMYIYLYGSLLDQVKHVLIGEYNSKFVCMDRDCLQVRIPPGTGTQSIALVDLAYNIHLTPYEFTYSDLQSRICFPAGTTVQTDQGIVEIQTIGPENTIDGNRVVALTKTYGMDADLVCIRRGALRKNYPQKKTLITRCHRLWLKGELVSAQRLLDQPGFSLVPYTGEKLYNVLLEKEGRMKVHGMWVETLDPINPIAKFFNGNT